MLRRSLLPLAAILTTAQTAPPPTPPPAAPLPRVAIETSEGRMVIELETARAPVTAGSFLRYVDGKRLDGVVFYRAVRVQPNFGFVQFGVQNAPKRVLPPIKHEPTTQTGVKHLDGALSIARNAPGTAQGDFTIMVGDQPSLDANPAAPGDNQGYAAFGRVVEGMDVVRRILELPKSSDAAPFKGEMLVTPVKIMTARRVE